MNIQDYFPYKILNKILVLGMTNDLKDKYLLSKLSFRHFKDHFYHLVVDFNCLTDRFIIIIGRFYRSLRIFVIDLNEIGQKGLKQS